MWSVLVERVVDVDQECPQILDFLDTVGWVDREEGCEFEEVEEE